MTHASPDEVIRFWFGEQPASSDEEYFGKLARWYGAGAALDDEVRARFGKTIEAALLGQLDEWARSDRGRLALVLVLDQLTRHVYRDTPRMYAGDPIALQIALWSRANGTHRSLPLEQRAFLLSPMVHAEDWRIAELAVGEFEVMAMEGPVELRRGLEVGLKQVREYAETLRRFGRFPHRNATLGRPSTPAELEWLESKKTRQPPPEVVQHLPGERAKL